METRRIINTGSNSWLQTSPWFDLGGSGPALKYALELGMDPSRLLANGQTNIFRAAKRGDSDKVKVGRIWFHAACFLKQ